MSGGARVERILVGIDQHDASLRAADWVAARPLAGPASIELLTIDNGDGDPLEQRRRLDLAAAAVRASRPEADVSTSVLFGPPDLMLVDAADEADLLVIGSRRLHPMRSAYDGWRPERISTMSAVPVVVVPEDWSPSTGDVLVGVDEGADRAAVGFAADEALRTHRRLTLLHAWRSPARTGRAVRNGSAGRTGVETRTEDPAVRAVLDEVDGGLAAAHEGLRCRTVLAEGDAAELLLSRARRASIVVVGRRHRTTLGGVLFGSTAHRLMVDCRTPLAIVPGAADRRGR